MDGDPFISIVKGISPYLVEGGNFGLWLKDVRVTELKQLPLVRDRMAEVTIFREKSTKEQTRELAAFPGLFAEVRQPAARYIAIPLHSSETRGYIPLDFCKETDVLHNSCAAISGATLYHFGVLMSAMHMAWVKTVCGRIKSDYRYSSNIVYNNFPWPDFPQNSKKNQATDTVHQAQTAIETAAQAVLDARTAEVGATLADLYNPPMPAALLRAHRALDAAVDAAYAVNGGKTSWKTDAERVAFLFERYAALTNLQG